MLCTLYSGVLQLFTTVCTAHCKRDADKAWEDLAQQSSACNSLCQLWCRIILCPRSAVMGGSQGERAYSSWNDLAVSAHTCSRLRSSYETAKWSRSHSMSLLDKMSGTHGPHSLAALLQFQFRTSTCFQDSSFSVTCFLKDPTKCLTLFDMGTFATADTGL